VDENGLIQSVATNVARFDHDPVTGESLGLLVEEARTNTFQYSNDFSNAYWSTYRTVLANPNGGLAPDGTFTANYAASAGTLGGRNRHIGGVAPGFVSISIHVKAKTATSAYFSCDIDGAAASCSASYTFATNTATSSIGSANSPGNFRSLSTQAISLPNGWTRLVFVFDKYAGSGTGVNIRFGLSGGSGWMWGACQEAGAFPTSYIPTPATFTSRASTATYYDASGTIQTAASGVARDNAYFPDENGVFRPAGLLLEAAGTNLVTYSEQFDNAAWSRVSRKILAFGSGSVANATTAPDGTTTADLVVPNTTSTIHYVAAQNNSSAAGTYTVSCFAKPSGYSWILLQIGAGASGASVFFNVGTGQIGSNRTYGGAGNFTVVASSIAKLPNGWYRCSMTITSLLALGYAEVLFSNGDGVDNATFAGNGTSGVFIWGCQLEAGFHPTSYIPTTSSTVTRAADVSTSSTVTRAADVASITGSNFSSWYNQSEGTLLSSSRRIASNSNSYAVIGGSNPNVTASIRLILINNGNVAASSSGGGSIVEGSSGTGLKKYAGAYATNNFGASINGSVNATDTSNTTPICDRFYFGGIFPTHEVNAVYARLTYYPTRLSNALLQKLTK
jgi:hypothetical protein